MTKIQWKDEYSVGNDALDADHKTLIALIDQLSEAGDGAGDVNWALQQLDNYTQGHFKREEEQLIAANYAEFDAHKAEHKNFIAWLETVKSTYSLEPESAFYLTDNIVDYLTEWLIHHILKVDMDYKGQL